MQAHDSKSMPSLAIPLAKMLNAANASQKKADRLAKLLSEAMAEIHGGEWRVEISHEVGAEFVMIAPKPSRKRPTRPAPEYA